MWNSIHNFAQITEQLLIYEFEREDAYNKSIIFYTKVWRYFLFFISHKNFK